MSIFIMDISFSNRQERPVVFKPDLFNMTSSDSFLERYIMVNKNIC